MVLVSFLLVLAAAVTLVIGLLSVGLGLIYVSIACSVLAGVVLAVAVVRSRPRPELAVAGPAPLSSFPQMAPLAPEVSSGAGARSTSAFRVLDEEEELEEGFDVGAPVEVGAEPGGARPGFDAGFPIPDYDDRMVSEILPLLDDLDQEELAEVRARELAGAVRSAVLGRIEALIAVTARPTMAPAAPARRPATPTVRRTGAGKAGAAKAGPKKAASASPAKKAAAAPAASAAKAVAKKASAAKAVAKKAAAAPAAPVAKAVAKKAVAAPAAGKRSAAAKAPAKKAVPAKKAAPAKKTTTAKKAAPAKKA